MAAKITRRRFIKYSILAGSALGVGPGGRLLLSENDPVPFTPAPPPSQRISGSKAPRVIFISVDSLDPRYLYLDSRGQAGGRDGDWLMPQVREFLEGGVWLEHARCHMPALTDPNHLNSGGDFSSRRGDSGRRIGLPGLLSDHRFQRGCSLFQGAGSGPPSGESPTRPGCFAPTSCEEPDNRRLGMSLGRSYHD